MKQITLTPAQARLYFGLYVTLALICVVWVGGMLVLTERPTAAPPPYAAPTAPAIPRPFSTPRKAGATISVVGTSELQSLKSRSRLLDSGSIPDTSTIRGGALVSTGDGRAVETAEVRGLVNQPETNKRQLRVAEGGLTAPEDAGSPRHQNQPSVESLREWTFAAADKCKVPTALLFRQVRAESGFNPYALSASGAQGIMQIKPYHSYWPLDLWDPETNLNLGACILRRHYERMGSWELALHAYHDGQYRTRTSGRARRYARKVLGGTRG